MVKQIAGVFLMQTAIFLVCFWETKDLRFAGRVIVVINILIVGLTFMAGAA